MDKQLFQARISDGILIGRKRPFFFGFMSLEEAASATLLLSSARCRHAFWGGYDQAERKILGVFPEHLTIDYIKYPITAFTFTYRPEDHLRHQDFLGALMALGLERSVIGDILPGDGRCVAFVKAQVDAYVAGQITKIGRAGVKLTPGFQEPLPNEQGFREKLGVIASPRLDCFVSFLCRISREKALNLIKTGLVFVNHLENGRPDLRVEEGDVISIRKHGRFIVDQIGADGKGSGKTAKGRLRVKCRMYE